MTPLVLAFSGNTSIYTLDALPVNSFDEIDQHAYLVDEVYHTS